MVDFFIVYSSRSSGPADDPAGDESVAAADAGAAEEAGAAAEEAGAAAEEGGAEAEGAGEKAGGGEAAETPVRAPLQGTLALPSISLTPTRPPQNTRTQTHL